MINNGFKGMIGQGIEKLFYLNPALIINLFQVSFQANFVLSSLKVSKNLWFKKL